MNHFFRFLMLAVGMVGCAFAAEPPLNVLFIVVDDLKTSLGCYGDEQVKSPNIDRLAAKGVRFDRAYCQYPVCNASRSSFLTGQRPDRTGIFSNGSILRHEKPDLVTLPQLFRQNGYFTASIGKITHAGVNEAGKPVLFEDPKAYSEFSNGKITKLGRTGEGRNLTGGELAWCEWLSANGTDDDQPDGQNAATAIKIIEDHKDVPFFIGMGFHKPHDPFFAPKKYFDLYPLHGIQLANEPADRSDELPLAIPRGEPFGKFTDRERKEFRRAYFAGISFTDAQIGKLLDTLDRLKLWDNTVVVLMGDHGYHLGEHGWWNKMTVFELCARTPLIVWAPRLKGMGKDAKGIVEFIDLYPTLTDLCGLSPAGPIDGQSFRKLLDDPGLRGKSAAFTQVVRGKHMGRSIRGERWRYTEWADGESGVELYDHNNDPLEYYNLATNPKYKDLMSSFSKQLRDIQAQ